MFQSAHSLILDRMCNWLTFHLSGVQEFLEACGQKIGSGEAAGSLARGDAQEPYLTQPTALPELKAREGSTFGGGDGGAARGGSYGSAVAGMEAEAVGVVVARVAAAASLAAVEAGAGISPLLV